MKRIVKSPEERKTEIIETAERLFLKKGFSETTVEDILQAANLSKGGFYHHYSSKEEVLAAIISKLVDEILQETQTILNDPEYNALQKLQQFFEKQLFLKKPKILLARCFAREKQDDYLMYKYNALIWQKYVGPLSQIVQQGVSEGLFKLEYPYETVDILIRTISSLGDLEETLLQDKDQFIRYVSALKNIAARTLGIDKEAIQMIDDVLIASLFDGGK